EHLLETGRRLQTDIVAVAGDAVDVHDVACLISVGASAVHPYLALAAAGAEGELAYRKALDGGLLKVMAKMGISCVASYRGGHVLEALGLGAEVMRACFPTMPSRVGGANLADLERAMRERLADAGTPLPDHGRVRFRKAGEHHAYNPLAVRAAQRAAESGDREAYLEWQRLSRMEGPQALRDLLHISPLGPEVPLADVEPASEIAKRFVSIALSLGARSNSGEGGEDPDSYIDGAGPRRDNRVKQVASARFGVTPQYLKRADELEIKIAQGSKPGEGGQLPGMKVTDLIARLR